MTTHVGRLPDFPDFQTSDFPESGFPESGFREIRTFRKYGFSDFRIFRIFGNSENPEIPYIRICRNPDFRISGYPDIPLILAINTSGHVADHYIWAFVLTI